MPGLRVGLVITLSISVASAQLALDFCTFNNVVNGCSIPGHLPAPYKRDFTPACNRHDICYACGLTNGVPKEVCDKKFLMDMESICAAKSLLSKELCSMSAHVYYGTVEMFGANHYHPVSHAWCKLPWIQLCMPPPLANAVHIV